MTQLEAVEISHSRVGASSASRWMNCAGSNNLIAKVAKTKPWIFDSTTEADEGTAAHTLLSECLLSGQDAWMRFGETILVKGIGWTVNAEMVTGVQVAIDYVRGIMEQHPKAMLYVEQHLRTTLDKEVRGTGDIVIVVPGKTTFIIDFKYGAGIAVEPESVQLKYYGALALEQFHQGQFEWETVVMAIVQPRIEHAEGFCRSFEMAAAELLSWFDAELLPAVTRSRDPNAPLVTGEWCRFCPAKTGNACPALIGEAIDINPDLEPVHMTNEELGLYLSKESRVKAFFRSVAAEAFRRAMDDGAEIPGKRLGPRRTERQWKAGADAQLVAAFGERAFEERKLKSPAQIELLKGGKEIAKEWAFKPDAGMTLVDKKDKVHKVGKALTLEDQVGSVEGLADILGPSM